MEKKKKRLLILSIIAGVIVLVLLLSSTVFTIKDISVEYNSTLISIKEEDFEGIIKSGEFEYGSSVFFTNFEENIALIEKNNPYIKVNNIERKFPSYAVINISERVPVVKIMGGQGAYVFDNELKLLNIVSSESEYNGATGEKDRPILKLGNFNKFELNVNNLSEGEFLDNELLLNWVGAFYEGAVQPAVLNDSQAVSCIYLIDTITINFEQELNSVVFDIVYRNKSVTSKLIGDENLADAMYNCLSAVVESGDKYKSIDCINGKVYYGERL